MAWAPRSLFGRNVLLIGLLMAAGQLASALLVRELLLRPRLEQIADGLAGNIGALRDGLLRLPAAQREAFAAGFNRRGEPAVLSPPRRPLTRIERALLNDIGQRIAANGSTLAWQREDAGTLTVRLVADGRAYALRLPGVLPARDFNGTWALATLPVVALTVLGAWALQRHLNRPLARVVQAADALSRGVPAPALPEDGPLETATLARSFNQLGASLARTERERALMLAGVSHDLRTPLTKLRLGVEILRERAEPELVASMTRSVEEMDAIVGQFLDFARDDTAEPLADRDLDALVRRVARASADHGRPLALTLGAPRPVPMRENALERAVSNLVENAWRHGRAPVSVHTGGDANSVWLEVTDHGDGIAAADAQALKQPFRRALPARAGVPGAGLGLAIVERIVRAHGGRFELLAHAPSGLRARIVLPAAQRAFGASPFELSCM